MTRTAASLVRGAIVAGLLAASSSLVLAQTLTIGVRGGPDSIDPHFTATGTHAETLKHVFDTLVWSGDGLEIEPRLAESWKAIDNTTWEFKLRRGVKFHDGSDFTAEDVKFSIERIPVVAGPNPTTIYVRRVREVKIIDPLTVHIVTDGPAPNLPNDFIRLFVVSHKAAAGVTKDNGNELFNSGKAAIGTGPYKFVSWTPKGDFVADRFDGYWGGKEPWARIVRKEIPNDASRVAQLKAGQLDLITRVPASDVDHLRLAVLRQQLAHLSSIYDADHPSVRKLQAQIGEVEATVAASNAAAATGTIRLRGDVEIRTTTMTLTADEADYDRQTGEIEARGTVRVKPNSK